MYDQDEVCQCRVVIRALILPALIEKFVKFVPSLELEYGFKLQFDNLEVLGHDVSLGGPTEFVHPFRCGASELLTVLARLQIVLSLYQSVTEFIKGNNLRLTLSAVLSSARANVV
jgi:hypothetical protein